jgi:RNA polymerase sigma-70 factor (ECF subfamily)
MKESSSFNISKLKAGDKSEYERIYFEFYDVLFSLGKQYLMNAEEAEEIVQEAFLKLWEIRVVLHEKSNIKNFLYTLVKNNCLNYIRNKQNAEKLMRNYHYQELQYRYEALDKLGDNFLQYQELKGKIDTAIDALPENLKIVFEMNRFQDLRYKDIAHQLKISEKTVEARMSKALKILRNDLKDYLPVIYLVTGLFS